MRLNNILPQIVFAKHPPRVYPDLVRKERVCLLHISVTSGHCFGIIRTAFRHIMILSIPPRLSISKVMGMLKGKTAIKLFKSFPALRKKPYWGNHFWSRGYCVSSIGLDENKIRKYVKYQEEKEKREESEQQEFGLV